MVRPHSANSLTGFHVFNDIPIFRKQFTPLRSSQYFNEYFINRYLSSIHPGLVAHIIKYSHDQYYIDYEPYVSADCHSYRANDYLSLITLIHRFSLSSSSELRLLANQPFTDIHSFSSLFLSRINSITILSHPLSHSISTHLTSLQNFHSQLISSLSGYDHCSNLVFSHADSGLHNCLLTPQGNLLLADLEYAGLDSPIKQCIDYLLHPKTQLYSDSFGSWFDYFTSEIIAREDLPHLHLISSLLALKWSLIMLNEFRPHIWDLRVHSDPSRASRKQEIFFNQYNKSLLYYKAARSLADGLSPVKLFGESDKNLLSHTY